MANNVNTSDDTTKILRSINQNILGMKKNTGCIDERLDCINDKVNQTTLDVELHQETLMKLLPTLASLIDEFICPIILSDIADLRNRQQQLQKLYTSFNTALDYLKTDYAVRRRRSISPLPSLAPSQLATTSPNNTQNNETDHKISK